MSNTINKNKIPSGNSFTPLMFAKDFVVQPLFFKLDYKALVDEECAAPRNDIIKQACTDRPGLKEKSENVVTLKKYFSMLKDLREKEPNTVDIRNVLKKQIDATNEENKKYDAGPEYDAALVDCAREIASREPTAFGAAFKTFMTSPLSSSPLALELGYTPPNDYFDYAASLQTKSAIEAEEAEQIKVAENAVDHDLYRLFEHSEGIGSWVFPSSGNFG